MNKRIWMLATYSGIVREERKEMNKRIWMLTTVLALLALVMLSCGTPVAPTEQPAETTEAAPTAAAPGPTEEPVVEGGGTLVWVNWPDVDTLDPHATAQTWAGNYFNMIYDPLVWRGPNQDLYPGLAESWEVSDDGTTWTFYLRDGVTFHDGTPFDAEAVKYNFDRIKGGTAVRGDALAAAGDMIGSYESAEVIDDLTVALHFAEPLPAFLDAVSSHFLGMVSPAAVEKWGDEYAQHPVGAGAFMFVESEPDHLTLKRNPDYNWAPSFMEHQGPPYLEEVIHLFVEEAGTRAAMLESGEAQLLARPSVDDLERFMSDPQYVVEAGYGAGLPSVNLPNVAKYPTDDVRVRQALIYAMDRELMCETLWDNFHRPAYGPLASTTWGYDPAVEAMYPYDPEKARELLEEAGWTVGSDGIRVDKDGNRLHLVVQSITHIEMVEAHEFLQALVKDVGIEFEIVVMDTAATNDLCTAGKPEICPLYYGFTDPLGLTMIFHSRNAGTGFNWGQVKDPKLDELLTQGETEVDEAKRQEIYSEVQKYIMEQAYVVPVNEWGVAHIHSVSVEGVQVSFKEARFANVYDARFVE